MNTRHKHTEADMEETSSPMPLDQHRRYSDQSGPKRFFRFDPTVSSGTMIQIGSIVVMAAVAYGTYREDQTKTKAEIDAVKVSAERDRTDSRGAITQISSDMKDVKADVSQINKTLAVLEAQGRMKQK